MKEKIQTAKAIIIGLLVLLAVGVSAQTVKQDKDGNYVQVKDTSTAKLTPGTATGKTYTDSKGVKYPVYKSSTGKLYVIRTSKNTGAQYKQYLKVQ